MNTKSTQTVKQFTEHYKLGNPFNLENNTSYHAWREHKLENYPENIEDLIIEIKNPKKLSNTEYTAIQQLLVKTNMVIYASNTGSDTDKTIPVKLGEQFGLTELDNNMGADDGITSLKVVTTQSHAGYIPYTNKAIHWHTDGYYNDLNNQISSLLLHCVSPAENGGQNSLLDHEIAYIHLRDSNPDYIAALMRNDVMSIPPNIENGKEIRPLRSGPVFSIMLDGNLHMRYTARTRSIEWKKDFITQAAVKELNEFTNSKSKHIYRATLQSGQGLISNNVLHDRSSFKESFSNKRLIYRLRYYQRIANT